jgi:L,D-transpeptidase catalytic domain/Putative peptidoglycan binding domain
MRRRRWLAAGILLTLCVVALAGGAVYLYLWDRGRSDRIADGVRIAGFDVGGMRAPQARALLEKRVAVPLRRPVRLVYGIRAFTVRPRSAGLDVDVDRMVDAAVQISRSGGLVHRLWRDLRDKRVEASIPLRAGVSRTHVAAIVRGVARTIDYPAVDARLEPKPLATGLLIYPSKLGLAVKRPLLEQRLTVALLRYRGLRAVAVPTRAVHPHVWRSTLERDYATYLLVSRETFTLRLYKNLKLVKSYGIAVGRAGLETPAGEYTIDDKQVNPSWHVPNSAWAGDLAGKVIPPGPDDPIKARWMGFYNGAGIHGTTEDWSIGSAASHGCIRMHIPDVEDLYDRVPLHTPIYVG